MSGFGKKYEPGLFVEGHGPDTPSLFVLLP